MESANTNRKKCKTPNSSVPDGRVSWFRCMCVVRAADANPPSWHGLPGLHPVLYLVCLPSTPIISTGILQKRILRLVLRGEQHRIAVVTSLQAPNPERPRHRLHSFGRYEAMTGSGSCPSDVIVFLDKCGRLMLLSLCLCPCLLCSPLFHF